MIPQEVEAFHLPYSSGSLIQRMHFIKFKTQRSAITYSGHYLERVHVAAQTAVLMITRVLSSAVVGHGRAHPFVACPAFLQFSAGLGATKTGSNRCTHTSPRVSQGQDFEESTPPQKTVQQRDGGSLRPKVKSQFSAIIDAAKDEHKHLTSHSQFSLAIDQFLVREKYRKGHVAFIRLALQRMDEFGLEKDLATYNKLLEVFPKGRFKPRRMLDALWPRSLPQMELALDLLTKMEDNGVNPSLETYRIVKEIFGGMSFPFQKCVRMMYLFDKYENADPYKIQGKIPANPVELARLTLKRIAGADGQITEHMVSYMYMYICHTFMLLKDCKVSNSSQP